MIVLIVVGVAAGLCLTGGAVTGAVVSLTAVRIASGPGHATNVLLDDIEADRAATAYRRLCHSTRDNLSEQDFATLIRTEPRLISHRIVDSKVTNVDGRNTATVTARLTLSSGPDSHTFPLIHESGAWRVCGQPF